MRLMFKFLVSVVMLFAFVLGDGDRDGDQNIANLEEAFSKLQVQLTGSKVVVEAMQKIYDADVASGASKDKLNASKSSLDEAKLYSNSLAQEAYRLQKSIDSLKKVDAGAKGQIIDIPQYKTTTVTLLPGWNAFAIPVNTSLSSSSEALGKYSTVWAFDGNTKSWIKNPPVLYAGKGYFINISEGGYRLKFSGLLFNTDLGSVVKNNNTWYFLGASSEIVDIDYSKYSLLKYVALRYVKNPNKIDAGDAFWALRK